ncbi:glycosyltransferase family 2 protein [Poseidonocella sp. HB161398]|uniref:glycosyltransferase family 2 protein n=1 Tax=Poseidonocella sp. HB161398 TaxID=2320855 RepID=UPI0011082A07|nr:glycosyltransferase family 2 protein [Poseidonocella sp. HB161398]
MSVDEPAITYIVRCHSTSTLPKMKSALLSIAGQTYQPVKALVALQDLAEDDVATVKDITAPISDGTGLNIDVVNFEFPAKGDHRGALLNKALECVKSRYVAFLNYDDVVYPHHAETLISDLKENADLGVVASFGGCMRAYYDDLGDGAIYVTRKRLFRSQASVSDCIIENCFPIHSYVLDMVGLPKLPRFGEDMHGFEDYIFLLELMEHYRVSTTYARLPLCEYRLNNDNSNTVAIKNLKALRDREKEEIWRATQAEIDSGKRKRFFRVPYAEISAPGGTLILSKQPFLRGLFVCQIAKSIRKKIGPEEAEKFLRDPKRYARSLPKKKRSLVFRLLF